MGWARLAVRLQRFEATALAVGCLAFLAVSLFLAWRLLGFADEYPDCFGLTRSSTAVCETAQIEFGPWDQVAELVLWLALGAPFLVGGVLGAPIVAREIEQQTAQIAWSLALSRARWLARRAWPTALVLVALLLLVAVGGEVLTRGRLAGDDPGFARYDQRGVLVPLRGLVVFGIALLMGTWLGRTLPALLLTLLVSVGLVLGLIVGLDAWRRTEAQVVTLNELSANPALSNGMVLEPVAVLPDGTVTSERHADRLPPGTQLDALRIIPSEAYWLWIGRESAALAALTTTAVGMTLVGVRWRRPQ